MELHDAIKTIVDQFGKEVLTEERFVNILADVYPNRDNPAMMGIIRTLVKEGYCSDLLSCDENNVQVFISKTTLALNKKNGYDKKLVEDILYSLALGSGIVSPKVNTGTAPTKPAQLSKPSRLTPHKPASPQKRGSFKPVKQQKIWAPKNIQQNQYQGIIYHIDDFIVPLLGLFASIIFLNFYVNFRWWLFPVLLINAAIYFVTLIFFDPSTNILSNHNNAKGWNNKTMGILIAIAAMDIIVTISSLFLMLIWNLERYSGLSVGLALLICVAIIYYIRDKVGASIILGKNILKSKEFIITFSISLILYQIPFFLPGYMKLYQNCRNSTIQHTRDDYETVLAFKGIKLGTKMSDLTDYFTRNRTIQHIKIEKGHDIDLHIKGEDYSVIMDSALFVESTWNNQSASISVYSIKDTIRAIKIYTDTNSKKLLSMYEDKYGTACSVFDFDYKFELSYYYWKFKNGYIIIENHYFQRSSICYLDIKCEGLLEEYKDIMERERNNQEMKQKKLLEKAQREKRKQDSINEIKERERRKRQELQEREAIKQI